MESCKFAQGTFDHLRMQNGELGEVCRVGATEDSLPNDTFLLSSCNYESGKFIKPRDALQSINGHDVNRFAKEKLDAIDINVYVDEHYMQNGQCNSKELAIFSKQILKNKLISTGFLYVCGDSKLEQSSNIKAIKVITLSSKDASCVQDSTKIDITGIEIFEEIKECQGSTKAVMMYSPNVESLGNSLQQANDTIKMSITTFMIWGKAGCGKTSLVEKVAEKAGIRLVTFDVGSLNVDDIYNAFDNCIQLARDISEQKKCIFFIDNVDELVDDRSFMTEIENTLDINSACFNDRIVFFLAARNLNNVKLKYTMQFCISKQSYDQDIEHFVELLASNKKYVGLDVGTLSKKLIDKAEDCNYRQICTSIREVMTEGCSNKDSKTRFEPQTVNLFQDVPQVVGNHEAKKELEQVMYWHKSCPESLSWMDLPLVRTVLLYGEPGCGKTSLVRTLVHETKMPFFYVTAADIYSKYMGDSEKQLSEIFAKAKASAPSILFIDEIDSIMGKRKDKGESNVEDRIIISLFLAMDRVGCSDSNDKITASDRVVVIGATNSLDYIDASTLRRFDRIITVAMPDLNSRSEILGHYISKFFPVFNVDLPKLAGMTTGCSGADIECICKEALLMKLRAEDYGCLEDHHMEKAIMEIKSNRY